MNTRFCRLTTLFSGVCLAFAFVSPLRAAEESQAVVTIYNRSNVTLCYEMRCYRNGSWSDWQSYSHRYPNNGWSWQSFIGAEHIQIRFDRIGGDGEYTEKIYDLQFKSYPSDWTVGPDYGRKYYFKFDAGGSLLDLYTVGVCPLCGR